MRRKSPESLDSSRHENLLHWLAAGLRADLWRALGIAESIENPWDWALGCWRAAELRGERLVLALPDPPAEVLALKRDAESWLQAFRRGPGSNLRRPYYSSGGCYWLDAFAGVYLDDVPCAWRPVSRWPDVHVRGKVQPLALVALAATQVQACTGATPEEAALFLLCDVRFPAPGLRLASSDLGGMSLWMPDSFVTAAELAKQYAEARKAAGLSKRVRGLSTYPDELIRLVDDKRPAEGWQASWKDVLSEWNATKPEHRYEDAASISAAYRAAVKRRRERGLLNGKTRDEAQAKKGGENT